MPKRRLGRALLGEGLEPAADRVGVAAEVVEPRELGEALQPENALEQRRDAVANRADGLVTARLGDQPALDEAGDDRSAATPRSRAISGREQGPR